MVLTENCCEEAAVRATCDNGLAALSTFDGLLQILDECSSVRHDVVKSEVLEFIMLRDWILRSKGCTAAEVSMLERDCETTELLGPAVIDSRVLGLRLVRARGEAESRP